MRARLNWLLCSALCSTACHKAAPPIDFNTCPAGTHREASRSEHVCLLDNGHKEGPGETFFLNGQRKEAGVWHDNQRTGVWTYTDDDGALLQQVTYREGIVSAVEANLPRCPFGAQLRGDTPEHQGKAVWCQRHEGDKWVNDGPFMSWQDDNRPQAKGAYADDALDGPFVMWFADGSPKTRGSYVHGKEQGLWLSWHDNGHLFIKAHFVDGKEQGPWVSWWEEGSKSAEGKFEAGQESGPWTFWHPAGGKSEQGAYIAGQKEGWWNSWDADGIPQPAQEFHGGAMVSVGESPPPPP